MTINKKVILISDLDGTLLDHETYQFDAANTALQQIKQFNIPLILNSSKTAAEMILIREELKNQYPFVVENGAGIYLPNEKGDYERISFGQNRTEILATLDQLKAKFDFSFTGFNDMNVEELMSSTGLTNRQAILARQRDFTEPLKWHDSDEQWDLFCTELKKYDLTFAKGGRFISVSGKVDKGQALHWIRNYYQERLNSEIIIVALGDSENDRPMLECADYSILIKSPAHELPEIYASNLIVSEKYGSQGWNNAIIKLFETLNIS